MLDHPGLITDTGSDPVDATTGDPDPPEPPAPDTDFDIPPF